MNPPPSPAERKIRNQLPISQLFQSYLPLPVAGWLIRQGMARVQLPADVMRETVSADGVPCERLTPRSGRLDQVLLYLHGGGFVYGLTPPHMEMVAHLVRALNIPALLVDYRVAPDHPFPAALDDCSTVYHWLLKGGCSPQSIVVAGDSAGGNLTLTLLMRLRDGGAPLPAAAACLSPVADLTERAGSQPAIKDPVLPAKAMRRYRQSYVGGRDARDPLISPVFGDWQGLPPILVQVGEDEILRDDAVRVAALGKDAGVDVRLEVYPRMWHVWQLYRELPQALQALDALSQFLGAHLTRAGAPSGVER